jgi:hypothetical protein
MNLRSVALHTIGATAFLAWISISANAQVRGNASATSATHASAEMTKGKLNPSETRPGDQVALRLKDDVKSNGNVVLKKGTTITGVVRSVKNLETKGQGSGQAQSMMEIEWLAPAAQGRAAQQVSIALQSVTQVNRLFEQRQADTSDDFGFAGGSSATPVAARPSGGGGGGLLGGAVGGAVGATAGVAGGVGSTVGATSTAANRTTAQSNAALLNMPSVMAVDHQTASSLESNFGTSSSSPLFRVGHGELVSAGGSKQSVELFSHLSNDTMITSPSRDFEISSGAQMQLLVGVSKQ